MFTCYKFIWFLHFKNNTTFSFLNFVISMLKACWCFVKHAISCSHYMFLQKLLHHCSHVQRKNIVHVVLLCVLGKKLKCKLTFLFEKLILMSSNSYGIFSPCKNGVVGLKLMWACVAYQLKKSYISYQLEFCFSLLLFFGCRFAERLPTYIIVLVFVIVTSSHKTY